MRTEKRMLRKKNRGIYKGERERERSRKATDTREVENSVGYLPVLARNLEHTL
jgi:hypothetical protein